MTEVRMDVLPVEESPATIGYVLLVLMSAIHGWSLLSFEDADDDYIVALSDTGKEMFRLQVSPVMGVLMLSILHRMTDRLNGEPEPIVEDREPWTL